jgi:hypothetical protein
MRIHLQDLFYALRILFFGVVSTHDMERMPCLGCHEARCLPWMSCDHCPFLDSTEWPSRVVAADPCGIRHKEAQQDIAPNHDPLRVEPEGWQEVQLAAEWRRRSWCEDLSVRQRNPSVPFFEGALFSPFYRVSDDARSELHTSESRAFDFDATLRSVSVADLREPWSLPAERARKKPNNAVIRTARGSLL